MPLDTTVKRDGGDGQVTLGEQVIMKQTRARSADYMKEKCYLDLVV